MTLLLRGQLWQYVKENWEGEIQHTKLERKRSMTTQKRFSLTVFPKDIFECGLHSPSFWTVNSNFLDFFFFNIWLFTDNLFPNPYDDNVSICYCYNFFFSCYHYYYTFLKLNTCNMLEGHSLQIAISQTKIVLVD